MRGTVQSFWPVPSTEAEVHVIGLPRGQCFWYYCSSLIYMNSLILQQLWALLPVGDPLMLFETSPRVSKQLLQRALREYTAATWLVWVLFLYVSRLGRMPILLG